MNKTVIAIVIIFVLAIGGLFAIRSASTPDDNPYGKANLHPETVKQLDNPVYDNQVTDEGLAELVQSSETKVVYFYSPTCSHCITFSPVLKDLSKELNIDLPFHNLLEYQDSWSAYNIEFTPTVIAYKDGQEVARLLGEQDEATTRAWLMEHMK
ncbi:MAG: thioredoxin family protein [Bacilli bacterium]